MLDLNAKLSGKLPGVNVVFLAHIQEHLLLLLGVLALQHGHGLLNLRVLHGHLLDAVLHHLNHLIIHRRSPLS